MGLDIISFVIGVESAFGLAIPEKDAEQMMTPRQLIDYVHRRLPGASADYCLSQRIFYRLRQELCERLKLERDDICPETDLLAIVPERHRAKIWESMRVRFGAKWWPRLARRGWLSWLPFQSPPRDRMSDIVQFLVARSASCFHAANEGWTRNQVAEIIHALIAEEFGLPRSKYTEDSRWVQDMGIE